MKRLGVLFTAFAFVVLGCGSAFALNYSFAGNFVYDDDVQLFSFRLDTQSDVTLKTYSYAGGTNAAGDVIARGGFDPMLALFNSAGDLLDISLDGFYPEVEIDSVSGQYWDDYFTALLDPGIYFISLMQYDNFPVGPTLADSFVRDGQPYFTREYAIGDDSGNFYDTSGMLGNERDGHWALDILNVAAAAEGTDVGPAPIPEPCTMALLGAGLGLMGFARRRKMAA